MGGILSSSRKRKKAKALKNAEKRPVGIPPSYSETNPDDDKVLENTERYNTNPPSYSEIDLHNDKAHQHAEICTADMPHRYSESGSIDDLAVARLRRFMSWRLAVDYSLEPYIPKHERPIAQECSDFADLAKRYCLLLGMQLTTLEEVEGVKQELFEQVIEPAKILGIPSDIAEFWILTFRYISNHPLLLSKREPFEGPVGHNSTLAVTKLVVDFKILFDAIVTDADFAHELVKRCLYIHEQQYTWMLHPEQINLGILYTPIPSFQREPGDWPNVALAFRESWRPCAAALMNPSESESTEISIYSSEYTSISSIEYTANGYQQGLHYDTAGLRLNVIRIACKDPHRSALSRSVSCEWTSWLNPDRDTGVHYIAGSGIT